MILCFTRKVHKRLIDGDISLYIWLIVGRQEFLSNFRELEYAVKDNIQVVHMHAKLTVNGVLKYFVRDGESKETGMNLLQLDEQK